MSVMAFASGRPLRRSAGSGALILALATGGLVPDRGWAHEHHEHAAPAMAETPTSLKKEKLRLPDLRVVDQNAVQRRFYSDLVKDRVVVVSFIYTSCTAICSPLTANLKRARELLDPALAERASFISISIDPQTDTPEALKAFAERYGIGGNWHFVTGKAARLLEIQKAFSVAMKRKEDHTPLILIGNDASNSWTRKHGLAPPEAIAAAISEVAAH